MRKSQVALALLASLTSFTTVVHADTSLLTASASSSFTQTVTPDSITYSFTGLTLAGFEFLQVAANSSAPVWGTLTSVSVNATLDASVNYTYGDDLTIYVKSLPLASGGPLQVGGFSDTGALERHSWSNGGSSAPGTTVIDTVMLDTPLTFSGSASDPIIWLGNGYGSSDTEGTWSGSITLTGLSTVAPVPEPASFALMALGGLGMVGWVSRRRRHMAV